MSLHPRLHGPYLRHRIALNVWASRQLPEPGAEFPKRLGLRGWTAVLIRAGRRGAWRLAKHRFHAWTLLPGDQVHDFLRMLDGVVVRVPRPGQAEVVWATAEALYRDPSALEGASAALYRSGPWIPGDPVAWRESLPAVRLAPGWRYSRP